MLCYEGLWYDTTFTEARLRQSWTKLSRALCGQWNVVAVDLHNEPHKATWGSGNRLTDWNAAAERLGNHVLSLCPRWLIFVEGIAVGAPDDGGYDQGYWWGDSIA